MRLNTPNHRVATRTFRHPTTGVSAGLAASAEVTRPTDRDTLVAAILTERRFPNRPCVDGKSAREPSASTGSPLKIFPLVSIHARVADSAPTPSQEKKPSTKTTNRAEMDRG